MAVARDRFGIKPLYCSQTDIGLAISLEIKPPLSAGLVEAEPDLDALGELALFRYVANPNTLFKNIASVPPGSIARVDTDAKLAASLPMSQKLGPNGVGKILLKNLAA